MLTLASTQTLPNCSMHIALVNTIAITTTTTSLNYNFQSFPVVESPAQSFSMLLTKLVVYFLASSQKLL